MYRIDDKKCADCGYCAYVCPFEAIEHNIDEKYYFINQDKCKSCGQCFKSCIGGFVLRDKEDKDILFVEISSNCIGCTLCSKNCPVKAISGVLKEKHSIDTNKCIKCGLCASKCPKKAIVVRRSK